MRTDQSRLRRPGVAAATAALAVAGIVGGVGVAGARENTHDLLRLERRTSTRASRRTNKTTCMPDEQPDVTHPDGRQGRSGTCRSGGMHNAARRSPRTPADTAGTSPPVGRSTRRSPRSGRSARPARTTFVCHAHTPYMTGTIIVEGGTGRDADPERDRDAPTSTADRDPDVRGHGRRPTRPPTPDDHLTTPAPGKGKAAKDTRGAAPAARAGQVGVRQGAKLQLLGVRARDDRGHGARAARVRAR